MTPYAHYAAKPLPCSVPFSVIIGATFDPEVKTSSAEPRLVPFHSDEDEDFTSESYIAKAQERKNRAPVQKRDSYERYVAVLSKQKWTNSREISRALHICVPSVNRYLHSY